MNTSGSPPVYLTPVHAAAYLTPSESASSECRRRPTTSCIGRCTRNTLRPRSPASIRASSRLSLSRVIRITMPVSAFGLRAWHNRVHVGALWKTRRIGARSRLARVIPFLTESDLINTVPRALPSTRCRHSVHPSEACRPSASRNPRPFSLFVAIFTARTVIESGTLAGDSIADPSRKMDHESVTIHFPLGNYVIKMISGDGVMDDPRFLEYARNVP